MSDQWVHCCFFIPHSFELIYLTVASDKHHLSAALVDASNLTKFHLRTLPSGYASVPVALKEAHMRQNVSMWERRGQSQYRPHTPPSLLSSLKELLYSHPSGGAKVLCPAKDKLTFIDRVRRLSGKEDLRCCFWTEHLVHKHSACKAEKHGKGIMGGCRAVGESFHQHMVLQPLKRKDLPPR